MKEPNHRPHRLGFLAALSLSLCLSCMATPDDGDGESDPDTEALHAEAAWPQAGVHGQEYLADPGSCASSCHGEDLGGGFSGVSCADCHGDFPHPQGWGDAARHGEAARTPDALSRCGDCHGADFRGGPSGAGCLTCHPLYPHDADWPAPEVHGATVLAQDPVAAGCATSCHGTDFAGGASRVSCSECHDYPHAAGWAAFDRHGAAAADLQSMSCANVCHGADFRGGDSGISCFECHASYPHADWAPFTTHYGWVRQFGQTGCLSAQGCHTTFRGPVFTPPSDCTTLCHRASGG
ncbi:MAG: hypothetical protein AB1640_11425 [bacterium]